MLIPVTIIVAKTVDANHTKIAVSQPIAITKCPVINKNGIAINKIPNDIFIISLLIGGIIPLLMPPYKKSYLFCKAFFSFNYAFCRFACSIAASAQASGAPLYRPLAQFLRISSSDMLPRSYFIRSHINLVAALPLALTNLKVAPQFC